MNPLWPQANYKLCFFGQSQRFFEKKIGAPFRRVPPEEPCNARLKFQAVLYRCNFQRDRGAETCTLTRETPRGSSPKLNNCGRLLIVRLREDISHREAQTRYQNDFHAAVASWHF